MRFKQLTSTELYDVARSLLLRKKSRILFIRLESSPLPNFWRKKNKFLINDGLGEPNLEQQGVQVEVTGGSLLRTNQELSAMGSQQYHLEGDFKPKWSWIG